MAKLVALNIIVNFMKWSRWRVLKNDIEKAYSEWEPKKEDSD